MAGRAIRRRPKRMTIALPPRWKPARAQRRAWRLGLAVLLAAAIGAYVGYLSGPVESEWAAPQPAVLAMPPEPPAREEPSAAYLPEHEVAEEIGDLPEVEPGTGRVALVEPETVEEPPPLPPAPPPIATWRANVTPFVDDGRPIVAVVIDDLGMSFRRTAEVAALPAPLTLAFFPYAPNLPVQTADARSHGHELLIHMPMEPESPFADPGPEALEIGQEPAEMRRRLEWALDRFKGHIGINNHMGSRFTADPVGMDVVMDVLSERGLVFLDSRTTAASVGVRAAASADVPHAARDVFLDHERDPGFIRAALAQVEAVARRHGRAVAIGHPYPETIEALAEWAVGLDERGVVLAPLSAVIERVEAERGASPALAGEELRHEPGG